VSGAVDLPVGLPVAVEVHEPACAGEVHSIVLVVVGELDVEVELSGRLDQDVLRAEGQGVVAEGVGDRTVAGPHPDDRGPDEDHGKPTEEGDCVDALASGKVRVVEVTHQQRGLVVRDLHLNNRFYFIRKDQ
jgi:hypothetical protein